MTLLIRDGTNAQRTVSELVIRDGTNTPRTITEMWARGAGNTPRLIYSTAAALSASASPPSVYGGSSDGSPIVSDTVTVTPSGGVAPYAYVWTVLSYTAGTIPSIGSPTSAATSFTQSGLGPSETSDATFRCVVTDDVAGTATVDVPAFFFDFSGGPFA